MSACRLVATIVSMLAGFSTIRIVIASTSILSQVTSGNSRATSAAISSHMTMPWRCALDLVTTVSSLRGRDRASAKAKRMIRVTPARVKIATSVATPGAGRGARARHWPAYSPSEFSRTITQSSSSPETLRSGLVMPGRMRVGRTLAYWSKRLADRQPQAPQGDVVGHVRGAHRAEEDARRSRAAARGRPPASSRRAAGSSRSPSRSRSTSSPKPPSALGADVQHLEGRPRSPPGRCRRRGWRRSCGCAWWNSRAWLIDAVPTPNLEGAAVQERAGLVFPRRVRHPTRRDRRPGRRGEGT